jgi:hypothetical protein
MASLQAAAFTFLYENHILFPSLIDDDLRIRHPCHTTDQHEETKAEGNTLLRNDHSPIMGQRGGLQHHPRLRLAHRGLRCRSRPLLIDRP